MGLWRLHNRTVVCERLTDGARRPLENLVRRQPILRQNHHCSHCLQLAKIPGPFVCLALGASIGSERRCGDTVPPGVIPGKELEQRFHVFPTFTQGRHRDVDRIQQVVQFWPDAVFPASDRQMARWR